MCEYVLPSPIGTKMSLVRAYHVNSMLCAKGGSFGSWQRHSRKPGLRPGQRRVLAVTAPRPSCLPGLLVGPLISKLEAVRFAWILHNVQEM